MHPTPEQTAIVDAYRTGEPVAVEALAGTGKTATLRLLAESDTERGMTYVAYNRAIASEARGKFPRNVTPSTMHAFAMKACGKQFQKRLNNSRRMTARETADILGIDKRGALLGGAHFQAFQLTRIVGDTLARYMSSADREISAQHVPHLTGIDTLEQRQEIAAYVLPLAQTAWRDLTSTNGKLRFTHGVYLKLFELSDPVLPGDVILADEYQDTDPVIKSIIDQQCARGAQLIAVGDSNQQIYEWRGAVDALAKLNTRHRLPLQQSFRFGPYIASEANRVLTELESPWTLYGNADMDSRLVTPLESPACILTRTNAGAVAELFHAIESGQRVALVGGTSDLERMADGADALQRGESSTHPELMAFGTWREVTDYVEDNRDHPDCTELRTLVSLVDEHGTHAIREASRRTVDYESSADITISTAHKSKGRQWSTVRLGGDFTAPYTSIQDGRGDTVSTLDAGEARLQYVAITRAQYALDSSVLDWLGPRATSRTLPDIPVPESAGLVEAGEDAAQLVCDPYNQSRVLFVRTAYDPALVDRFRTLTGRRYAQEYAGYERVNMTLAGSAAIETAQDFGLTVSPDARARCTGDAS